MPHSVHMPSNEGAGVALESVPIRILVIGGSYAGLAATVTLLDLCAARRCRFAGDTEAEQIPRTQVPIDITIVDERDGYYHLIGSPLAFACEKYAAKAWQKFVDIPAISCPAVKCVQGSVMRVDCNKRSVTIKPHDSTAQIDQSYDYLIVSSGLRRTWPTVPESLERRSYLEETQKHIRSARHAERGVVVIGGGAVGIEMAAELKAIYPSQKVILIHSRNKLLSSEALPDEFKDRALQLLHEAGVETILGTRVTSTVGAKVGDNNFSKFTLELSNGSTVHAGHVINAVSKFVPTSTFMPTSTLSKEGYILINSTLSFSGDITHQSNHFAAGDIAHWSGIKRCGAAMHHGHYVGTNIYQRILQDRTGRVPAFLELSDVPPMMGLAVGKQAATYSPDEGVMSGADRMALYFGDDLGYSICWNYMRLGEVVA